jgi:glycosyltransferase involved in cell wall biosynthesis
MQVKNSVTVVTITRRRVALLKRAIQSVRRQDWSDGQLHHLIIVDDCEETADWLENNIQGDVGVMWEVVSRLPREVSGPSRLARLRNRACKLAAGDWIGFLDDDNEYEPNHIRTLLACAETTGSPAVHSYRKLFHFDGSPFLEPFWPWCRQKGEAQNRYWEYVANGILVPGSNVACERAISVNDRRETIHIDMNVWLLRRKILLECPVSDGFTDKDWIANLTEDDKLLEALINVGIPMATTGNATVRYYLGGYSNDFQGEYAHSEVWERPSPG